MHCYVTNWKKINCKLKEQKTPLYYLKGVVLFCFGFLHEVPVGVFIINWCMDQAGQRLILAALICCSGSISLHVEYHHCTRWLQQVADMLVKLMERKLLFILTLLIVLLRDLGFIVLQMYSSLSGHALSSRSTNFLTSGISWLHFSWLQSWPAGTAPSGGKINHHLQFWTHLQWLPARALINGTLTLRSLAVAYTAVVQ